MRGVVCTGHSIQLDRNLPEPQTLPGETLLRVRLAGICDTDLQLARGYMGFQGVLGHEFVAETLDGKRVTAEINNACHLCETCRAGRPNHCPHRTVLGILRHDGAMADLVSAPMRNIHKIPDAIEDRRAVFIEPLAAAFRMADQARIGLGTKVAILGDGKLGMLCAWVARAAGGEVTLIGKHQAKLDLAGPEIRGVLVDQADLLGRPFDVVADCTGSASGFPTALRLVRPCGTIVLKTTIAGEYTTNLAPVVIDEITILGSRCGPFPRAIAALAVGEIDVTPLIGAEFSLDDAEAAFQAASAKGARKVLLHVRGD